VTAESGSDATFTISAANATGDILVTIAGLKATEGSLSATTVLLTAANGYSADVVVTGLDDQNADGDASYTLTLTADGFDPLTVAVTNEDDDATATSGGRVYGTYLVAPGVNNATVRAQTADDNNQFTTLREGQLADGAGIDFRWQFTGLAPGVKSVQMEVWSGVEAFRMQYSGDNGLTWRDFEAAPDSALRWDGHFFTDDVGTSLWVRLTDAVTVSDLTRDTILIDLLTVSDAPVSGTTGIW
jgi:hypothetical protein